MSRPGDYFGCTQSSNTTAAQHPPTTGRRGFRHSHRRSTQRRARQGVQLEQTLITSERREPARHDNRNWWAEAKGHRAAASQLKTILVRVRQVASDIKSIRGDRMVRAFRSARRMMLLFVPAAVLALTQIAVAETKYPDKPIRLILPFGPGGVSDVTARIVAERLGQKLGEQVVVENMPGPGGINATRTVLRAPADGYTLGLLSNGTAISVDLFEHLPFDPIKQFAMVSEIGSFDLLIAVAARSKYKTLQDLIAAAKAHPGTINLGTISVGSTQNLGAELFRSMSAANMTIVPYRNSPDIVLALLRGDVDAMLDFPPAIEGQAHDGKLRIIGTSGLNRSPFLKDVPTAAESGVAGYNVTSWNGIFAPQGTPQDVIETLNKAITEVVDMPDVRAKFARLGVVAQASRPDELVAILQRDIPKWDAVIKKARIPKK